jgi:hypothetical protein
VDRLSPFSDFGSCPLNLVAPLEMASIIFSTTAKNIMTRITTPKAPRVPSIEPPTKSEKFIQQVKLKANEFSRPLQNQESGTLGFTSDTQLEGTFLTNLP